MIWEDPVLAHSMVYIEGVYAVKEEIEGRALVQAEQLIRSIEPAQAAACR